jgi:sulfur relay (sulfurtransferase) DsrC/TusE family protein
MKSTTNIYITKSYSLTNETDKLIKRIADYYGINTSGAIRLVILEIARQLNLNDQTRTVNEIY